MVNPSQFQTNSTGSLELVRSLVHLMREGNTIPNRIQFPCSAPQKVRQCSFETLPKDNETQVSNCRFFLPLLLKPVTKTGNSKLLSHIIPKCSAFVGTSCNCPAPPHTHKHMHAHMHRVVGRSSFLSVALKLRYPYRSSDNDKLVMSLFGVANVKRRLNRPVRIA